VSEGRNLKINLRGGRRGKGKGERGECDAQHGKRHVKRAVAFWGDVAVHRALLLGGWAACNGQCACRQRHLGGRCSALGGIVGGEGAMQDTVEAVVERRWCNGPCGGRGPQCLGTMQQCDGRCCWGRGGSAMDNGGGCSSVLVFYLHMGMGKID
jgi:hypothetical protein